MLWSALFSVSCSTWGVGHYHRAITQPVPLTALAHHNHYSASVNTVITRALLLSQKHLTYLFGSDNPRRGGMDCSGVIYYLLRGIKPTDVPRDSYEMYLWLLRAGKIHHVATDHFNTHSFNALKPGDLLFWTGTYRTNRRPPITHVMLYLGQTQHHVPLMFGASDGGIYHGKQMWGVSVFDFILPNDRGRERFVAYGCIPSFTCQRVLRR
jgi:cell wall-associated NlpC family hydrolase